MGRIKQKKSKNKEKRKSSFSFVNVVDSWHEKFVLIHPNPDVGTLGALTALWCGVGNPDRVGLNQCLFACQFLSMALERMGYRSEIIPARVTTEIRKEDPRVLGDRVPTLEGGQWSGHCILWIPEMKILFDPTIGQVSHARTVEQMHPALMSNEAFRQRPAPGSLIAIGRNSLSIRYEVLEPESLSSAQAILQLQQQGILMGLDRVINQEFRLAEAEARRMCLRVAG